MADPSNGWEAAAESFLAARSNIGAHSIQRWSETFPPGAVVLDLGCGFGVPITQALLDADLKVYGIDASPRMVASFRSRFPDVPVACEAVEQSDFFNRTFDGIVAWGLIFLLRPGAQKELIDRTAAALNKGGKLLFTAPTQLGSWADLSTGQESVSLGAGEYRELLKAAGLQLTKEYDDEGGNHYYEAIRPHTEPGERPPHMNAYHSN